MDIRIVVGGEEFPMDEAIARKDVGKATSGAISPKTLANLDSLGCGGPVAFIVNGKVYYRKADLLAFLRKRVARRRRRVNKS